MNFDERLSREGRKENFVGVWMLDRKTRNLFFGSIKKI